MIGKLRGSVDTQGADHVILDVQGVGYLVTCSPRTLRALPPTGQGATLAIETVMREDVIRLYGFAGEVERDWFRLLQGVQGVGAKVALGILGTFAPDELALAVAQGDKAAMARSPGVGPKLAARLVAELKDKGPASVGGIGAGIGPEAAPGRPAVGEDAVAALVNLGYGRPQAVAAVADAVKTLGADAATAALIRHGLKLLAA